MVNRTTITIHTRQRTVVRPLSDASLVRCQHCQTDVLGATPDCAANMLEVSTTAMRTFIESGMVHLTTASFGARLVCCNSLFNLSTQQDEEV